MRFSRACKNISTNPISTSPDFSSGKLYQVGISMTSTLQEVTNALSAAFCHEIVDIHGRLLLATKQALRDKRVIIDDSVGYESTMNKRYVMR